MPCEAAVDAVEEKAPQPHELRRRLQADVDGDEVPAGVGLLGDPGGAQVRLRAGLSAPADVDPDRPVGRGAPGGHRRRARRAAGVEAAAGVDLARSGGATAARSGRPGAGEGVHPSADGDRRPRAGPEPRRRGRGTGQRGDRRSARRITAGSPVPGRGDDAPRGRGRRSGPRAGAGGAGGQAAPGGARAHRRDEDRLGAARGAAPEQLGGAAVAEVDRVAVKAHAGWSGRWPAG